MRATYWIVNNPIFKIKNLKVCNISAFARKVGLDKIHSLILGARLKGKTEVEVNGWQITWSYTDPLAELFNVKQVPMVATVPSLTRKRHYPSRQSEMN